MMKMIRRWWQTIRCIRIMILPEPMPAWFAAILPRIGLMAVSAGMLEGAVAAILRKTANLTDDDLVGLTNVTQCKKLYEAASKFEWPELVDLKTRLDEVRKLYKRRNKIIHAAIGVAEDGSLYGIPDGSLVDLNTHGVGFREVDDDNTWTMGYVIKTIEVKEIDAIAHEMKAARLGLIPYMDKADAVKHPPRKEFPKPEAGKRLS